MRLLKFLVLSVLFLVAANIARGDTCTQDSRITPTNGGGGSPPLDPSGTFTATVENGCGTADLHVVAGTVEELTLTFNLADLTAPNTCANILTGGGSNAFFTLPGNGFGGIPGALGKTDTTTGTFTCEYFTAFSAPFPVKPDSGESFAQDQADCNKLGFLDAEDCLGVPAGSDLLLNITDVTGANGSTFTGTYSEIGATIPEPASLPLLLLGLASLPFARRKFSR